MSRGRVSSRTANDQWRVAVQREAGDGVVIFAVSGRLGVLSPGPLATPIEAEIDAGATRILLDLAHVDYVSSAGLTVLQSLANRAKQADAALVLCGLTEPVRVALNLSGMLPLFAIEESRASALARFAGDFATSQE